MERICQSKGGLYQRFRELRQGKEGFTNPCGKLVKPWIGYARVDEDYARVLKAYAKGKEATKVYAKGKEATTAYSGLRHTLGGLRQSVGGLR